MPSTHAERRQALHKIIIELRGKLERQITFNAMLEVSNENLRIENARLRKELDYAKIRQEATRD